jgi:hypothetical protein
MGQQPPPAEDPWQHEAPLYSVPPVSPEPGFSDYAAPDQNLPPADYSPPPEYTPPPPPPPVYQPPAPVYGPPPMYQPTPPRGPRTGLVIGSVAGGLVLALLVFVGVGYATGLFGGPDDQHDKAAPAPSPSPSKRPSPSPSASPPAASPLDNSSTDQTPFTLEHLFPHDSFTGAGGETYARNGVGFYSACENSGGDTLKGLLQQNGCGNMAVGVYLNKAQSIMTGVMVIPLPSAANATAVYDGIKADADIPPTFWIWCPPAPAPGAGICTSAGRDKAYRQWYYGAFHRYLLIAVALHTDGRAQGDQAALTKTDEDCRTRVLADLPAH